MKKFVLKPKRIAPVNPSPPATKCHANKMQFCFSHFLIFISLFHPTLSAKISQKYTRGAVGESVWWLYLWQTVVPQRKGSHSIALFVLERWAESSQSYVFTLPLAVAMLDALHINAIYMKWFKRVTSFWHQDKPPLYIYIYVYVLMLMV